MRRPRITKLRPIGVPQRIFSSLFFLVFLGMGLFFCGLIVRDVYRSAKTYSWPKAECVIIESRVQEDGRRDRPYRFHVRYDYQWQGKTYTGAKWSRREAAYSDYSDAQRLVSKYPADSKAVCFVNPAEPSETILKRPSLWFGLFIFLPLVFVGIGVIGLVAMWSRARPNGGLGEARPTSSRSRSRGGKAVATVVPIFFFVIGAIAFYFLTVRPLQKVVGARNWVATPCTVISSRVQSHRGNKGTTYRVDILYRYELNGEERCSSRYQFMDISSSGYKGKAEIVRRYPPGAQRTCFVNPRDPEEAVLERSLTPDMWFGAIPAVFMLIGAAGMIARLRK